MTKLPVQAIRIGDICIGTTACETFAETGLEFKSRSLFPSSFMVELAQVTMDISQLRVILHWEDMETWPGTNYLEPQATVKIIDALLEMQSELQE